METLKISEFLFCVGVVDGDQERMRLSETFQFDAIAQFEIAAESIWKLEANSRLARDRRHDSNLLRRKRHGEVVGKAGDLRDLRAGRRAQVTTRRGIRRGRRPLATRGRQAWRADLP